jgi:uncharacterized membrane protein
MEILTSVVARVLFGLPFAVFGVFHFINAEAMTGMVPIPGGLFWVYVTGVALIAASLGIMTNILGKWAALGLALLLVTFIAAIHLPGVLTEKMRQMATMGMLKDVALLGGALTWAGILSKSEK